MKSFERIARHCIIDRPEYVFEIDEFRRGNEQYLQAHVNFDRFSISIMKQALRDWKLFRSCVTAPISAVGEPDDAKWKRFVRLLGFKFSHEQMCVDGKTRPVFLSTGNPANEQFTEHQHT